MAETARAEALPLTESEQKDRGIKNPTIPCYGFFRPLRPETLHPDFESRYRDSNSRLTIWCPCKQGTVKQVRPLALTGTMAIVLGSLTFFVMFGVFLTLIPIHLDEVFGLGPTKRGSVAAVPAVTSTATALVVTWFRARMSIRAMVAVGLGVFAATFVAVSYTHLTLPTSDLV